MRRSPIFIGFLVGSFVGGWVVTLFGPDPFSLPALVGSVAGAVGGIVGGYKLSRLLG